MPTISRHWSGNKRGDCTSMCSVCGVNWPRSKMHVDSMGRLRCPDDASGRNELDLDRANAANASQRRTAARPEEGFGRDDDDGLDDPPQRLTIEDIESGA